MNKRRFSMHTGFTERFVRRSAQVFLLALFAFVMIKAYQGYRWSENVSEADAVDTVSDQLISLGTGLESVYGIGREEMTSLADTLAAYGAAGSSDAGLYEDAFRSFASRNPDYYLLRYEPVAGPGVRIPFAGYDQNGEQGADPDDGTSSLSVSAEALASESAAFKALRAMPIERGQVIASNIFERLDSSGRSARFVYSEAPVIAGGRTIGYLEAAVDLDLSLRDVTHASRSDEWVLLVDNTGRYLVPDLDATSAPDFIFNDYPRAVTDKIFGGMESDTFIYGGDVFSYRHVQVPSILQPAGGNAYWSLVSVSRADAVFVDADRLRQDFDFFAWTASLMALVIYFLLWKLGRMRR